MKQRPYVTRVTDKGIQMHVTLKTRLDSLAYNTYRDFSFIIVISGDNQVRVGKSMLGQQIAYYLSYVLERSFTMDHVLFDSDVLMERAKKLSPAVFIMDESRADFGSAKIMRRKTQNVMDFISESGRLNNILILILPDFFDLPKSLAIGASECLINCFLKEEVKSVQETDVVEFQRGYFEFYNRKRKKQLFLGGKKFHNYGAANQTFWGIFRKQWILDEDEYNRIKTAFILRDRDSTGMSMREQRHVEQRNALIYHLNSSEKWSQNKIKEIINKNGGKISQQLISHIITHHPVDTKIPK